eukprot:TRINITY_DN15596_c0_g1_i1.p1 TRINITY_DN15596_c0_g1~~TRINITY_DN15596_c0_g1_i1.p1  ORF type:complete len:308 (+),score=85.92 TRINITY_DN15596_c0_g1_i1:106-1029(+)
MGCCGSSDGPPPPAAERPQPPLPRAPAAASPAVRQSAGDSHSAGAAEAAGVEDSMAGSTSQRKTSGRRLKPQKAVWLSEPMFGREYLTAPSAAYTMQFKETLSGHSGGFVLRKGKHKGIGAHMQIEADGSDPVISYSPMEPGVGGLYQCSPGFVAPPTPGVPMSNPLPQKALIATVEVVHHDQAQIVDIVVEEKRRVQLRWIDNDTKLQLAAYPYPYPGHMDPVAKVEPVEDLPRYLLTSPNSMTGEPKENFNKGIFDVFAAPPGGQQVLVWKVRPQLDRSLGVYVQHVSDEVLIAGVLAARLLCQY